MKNPKLYLLFVAYDKFPDHVLVDWFSFPKMKDLIILRSGNDVCQQIITAINIITQFTLLN